MEKVTSEQALQAQRTLQEFVVSNILENNFAILRADSYTVGLAISDVNIRITMWVSNGYEHCEPFTCKESQKIGVILSEFNADKRERLKMYENIMSKLHLFNSTLYNRIRKRNK